jgi:hypothetical protein
MFLASKLRPPFKVVDTDELWPRPEAKINLRVQLQGDDQVLSKDTCAYDSEYINLVLHLPTTTECSRRSIA